MTDLLSAGYYLSLISSTLTRPGLQWRKHIDEDTSNYFSQMHSAAMSDSLLTDLSIFVCEDKPQRHYLYHQNTELEAEIIKKYKQSQRLCLGLLNQTLFDMIIWWNFSLQTAPPDYSQDCHPLGQLCCWLTVQHHTSGGKRCQEFPAVAQQSWRRAPRTSQANWETGDVLIINSLSFIFAF